MRIRQMPPKYLPAGHWIHTTPGQIPYFNVNKKGNQKR